MAGGILRIRARGTAYVQDHEALAGRTPINRFIGRRNCEVIAAIGVEGTPDHQPARHAHVDMGLTVEKSESSPFAHLYLEDICLGNLWPADEYTAAAAERERHKHFARGHATEPVVYDPTFGGEEGDDDTDKHAAPFDMVAKKGDAR
jgi:hypothetical protein